MNIWVNGCFDVLHTGHLKLLEYAKNYRSSEYYKRGEMNHLIVGIDSDERVRQLKGDSRPINSEKERKRMLEFLKPVDKVVIFNSDYELEKYIRDLEIDIMIIGDQYKANEVIGSEYSKHGVRFFPVDEHSTTKIIEKIKKS